MLLKQLLLAATFVMWTDQLLPSRRLAVFIGDAVIGAYVLDLYWLIQKQTTAGSSRSNSRD